MQNVQVHEWCFACVGWLDPCSGNDVHPHMHLQSGLVIRDISSFVLFPVLRTSKDGNRQSKYHFAFRRPFLWRRGVNHEVISASLSTHIRLWLWTGP
jgi:hypothetical protein